MFTDRVAIIIGGNGGIGQDAATLSATCGAAGTNAARDLHAYPVSPNASWTTAISMSHGGITSAYTTHPNWGAQPLNSRRHDQKGSLP
jgi:NAD(P)-dependent dehydrogenase (short-subunit alcohol dehydrogenase family)